MNKFLFPLVFLLFCCLNINAAAVQWTGGDGDWNDANRWSNGQVPSPNDEVTLTSGTIKLSNSATIQSLKIDGSATLIINTYGRLTLLPTSSVMHAMQVHGKVTNYGTVQILDQLGGSSSSAFVFLYGYIQTENGGTFTVQGGYISVFNSGTYNNRGQLNITNSVGTAIQVRGKLFNRHTIDIEDCFNGGIHIHPTGQFVNHEDVFINNVGTGISNERTVYNYGNFHFSDCSFGISNRGLLRNFRYSTILLEAMNTSFAFYNDDDGEVRNQGNIRILDSDGASNFRNYGLVTNYSTGNIQLIGDSWYEALRNSTGGEIRNYGDILINSTRDNLQGALLNEGNFTNYSSGEINISGSFLTGLNNAENFTNNGRCVVDNSLALALNNDGILINTACGEIEISTRFENQGTGVWLNESWLRLTGNYNHVNNGYFQNAGVIEDIYNSLSNLSFSNDGIIARPLSGPVQAGINYNILEIGSLNQLGLPPAFYDSPNNGNKAGTYYESSNTLDIYNSAVGLDAVYFEAELLGYGCTAWFQINIPGQIQPAQSPFPQSFGLPATNTSQLQVYPNPSNGIVNVKWPEGTTEQQLLWTVHNLQGQQVARGDSRRNQLDLSALPAATYILRTQDSNGQWQVAERIIIE